MAKVSKETKDLNQQWTEKQKDIGKSYKSYYLGGFLIALFFLAILAYLFLG